MEASPWEGRSVGTAVRAPRGHGRDSPLSRSIRSGAKASNELGQTIAITISLLAASNVFMTFAWYGHLKHLHSTPWFVAALVSWGIALFEYLLQVPANRIGFAGGITLAQLKILQEVITLAVFVPFAMLF